VLDVNEMRQAMQAKRDDAARNRLFMGLGAGVVGLGAAGGLVWALADMNSPKASPKPQVAAVTFDLTSGEVRQAKTDVGEGIAAMENVVPILDGQMLDANTQLALYNETLNRITACREHWKPQALKTQYEQYEKRNKAAHAHWEAISNKAWDYNPTTTEGVMVGAMTGQIQQSAIGRMISFEAMMAGSEDRLTPQECALLRQAINRGERDLAAPPPG
jgi:hypothetical protein